ncbi:hypothetical protein [Actinacidiphila glaucinigra]|uniref:hypothetical protein n=1 Tax=Actinacidiphila glaucinigra TaxID=235986 RepID=UPI0035D9EBC4
MTSTEAAARRLQDQAALWSLGAISSNDVVREACDALVAGLDGPALRRLAACTRREADYDVPEILPAALEELGLTFYALGSQGAEEAAARALAAAMLAGQMTPRALASQIHQRFGHELPLVEDLALLDDEYDVLDYSGRTVAEVDAEVVTEAKRVLGA